MYLILIPSEVEQKADILKNSLVDIIENYKKALQVIQNFSDSEELNTETYDKLKLQVLDYHQPIVQGMIAAEDSILEAAESLKQSVGSEELNERLLKDARDKLKSEQKNIRRQISEYQKLQSNWFVNFYGSAMSITISVEITRLQEELEKMQQVLEVIQKKLDTLIEINGSTAGLFDDVINIFSAIEAAINDAGVEITGVGEKVEWDWREELSNELAKTDEKIILFIEEALEAELQIDLDELIELYGDDVVERMIEIVNENGIDRFGEGNAEKVIEAVMEGLTGYQVTKVDGKYQYVDREGITTEFTKENMMNGFELYAYVNNSIEVAQWYVNNIDTYSHRTKEEKANAEGDTDNYSIAYVCDLQGNLNGCGVYDDCSGFVMATLIQSGYMESDAEKYSSYAFLPGGDAESIMLEAGFTWHPMSELTGEDLQKGDILVKGGHVEIFYGYNEYNKELALTWGDIYDELPTPKKASESNINQIYTGIWRIEI